MASKPCLTNIKQNYNNLTEVEKKIADYVLDNANNIISMSIASLSEKSQVVSSAVIRFCKSVGFTGYADFKIALAMELSKNKELNFSPYVSEDDSEGNILDKIFSANVKTLHATAEKTDRNAFKNAVKLIKDAHNIHIYGVGTSSFVAKEFQFRLMQLGYSAQYFVDISTMKTSILNIKKNDVAIGISHSGRTIATVDALAEAKKAGAKTIAITSFENSVLSDISDVSVIIYSDEIHYPIEAMSARIAHLSMIEAISTAVSVKNYDKTISYLKRNFELMDELRYKKKKKNS